MVGGRRWFWGADCQEVSVRSLGLLLVLVGVLVVVAGLLVWSGALSWFGRLPGDVRVEREAVRVYVPVTSMLVASAVLSAVLWLVRKLF